MNEMKTSKTDIGIVVIFTTLSIFLFNVPILNNAEILMLLKIAVFFLLGYSLLTALFPKNNISKVKFVLVSILVSIILVFSLALILGVFLDFNNGTFINTALVLTNVFIAVAFIRRIRSSNKKEDRYIVCESCESYYKLGEGEKIDDFEACRCGGRLKYAEGMVSPKPNWINDDCTNTENNLPKFKSLLVISLIIISGVILYPLIGIQLILVILFLIIFLMVTYLFKTDSIILKHRFFANFLKYRFLLMELVKRDIKIKYRRSVLGIFWSFLNPLLFMIVLTLIFSVFFARDIPNFPVYLLIGRIVFDLYAQGSKAAMNSIKRNSAIIKKVYIPKYMYSLSSVLSNFVTFALSLIVLFMVMIATNAPFTIYILFAILPIVLLLMFTIGAGLILATVTVFFRDMEHLYGVFITLLMYGSAIFYPIEIVPENYRIFFELNPVYAFISLFRDSFLYGRAFEPTTLLYAAVSAIVLLVVGIVVFYKYQDKFILYI